MSIVCTDHTHPPDFPLYQLDYSNPSSTLRSTDFLFPPVKESTQYYSICLLQLTHFT